MQDLIFIDTSAFYALIDRLDLHHAEASDLWSSMLNQNDRLLTSNYVTMETLSLIQKRIGSDAAYVWYRDILAMLDMIWIDRRLHRLAYEIWRSLGGRGDFSLVDCTSFVAMHENDADTAFCFKPAFKKQGFTTVPQ